MEHMSSQRVPSEPGGSRAGALAGAALALLAFAATYALLVTTQTGQIVDNEVMERFGVLTGNEQPRPGLLGEIQIQVLLLAGVVLAMICMGRRSWRLFVYACAVILATTGIAIALKAGLPRPALGVGAAHNSYPSNTVAAFTSVALSLAAVVSPGWQRTVRHAGMVVVLVIGVTVIALQWHRPSDVIGGILIAVAVERIADALFPDQI